MHACVSKDQHLLLAIPTEASAHNVLDIMSGIVEALQHLKYSKHFEVLDML